MAHSSVATAPRAEWVGMKTGAGCYKVLEPHTHFYGFGERTGSLDKGGTAMTLWNTDDCPYTPGTDRFTYRFRSS